MKGTIARCVIGCAMTWGLLVATAAVAAPITPAELSVGRKAELADMLAASMQTELEALKNIDRQAYPLDGQIYPAKITARFDEDENAFVFELGSDFIPPGTTEVGPALEDQLNWLRGAMVTWLHGELTGYQIHFTFDGRDIYFYCPDSAPRPDRKISNTDETNLFGYPFPPNIWTP